MTVPEKLGRRWKKSGTMMDPDPDSLWTGQKVGRCEKLGGSLRISCINKRNLLKKRLGHCLRNSRALAGPVRREEEGCNLLQIRVPHGLIKVGHQWLRGVSVPKETLFNRGTKLP